MAKLSSKISSTSLPTASSRSSPIISSNGELQRVMRPSSSTASRPTFTDSTIDSLNSLSSASSSVCCFCWPYSRLFSIATAIYPETVLSISRSSDDNSEPSRGPAEPDDGNHLAAEQRTGQNNAVPDGRPLRCHCHYDSVRLRYRILHVKFIRPDHAFVRLIFAGSSCRKSAGILNSSLRPTDFASA